MNILQINKFFYIRGGSSRYFFEVSKLLSRMGHNLAFFSMQDKNNQKSTWSKYFISNISFEKPKFKDGLKILGRMIYSLEARKKISELLKVFRPEIVHIHNIYHHISPSILYEFKNQNIPVVYSVSDYHLISAHHNGLFHNGEICERAKINKFYKLFFHKCVKDSYLASFLEALEHYINQLFEFYTGNVDYFIVPSKFTVGKLKEYQFLESKIVRVPYFVDCRKFRPLVDPGDYLLYFGRLSKEKGIIYLIEAMRLLPSLKLKIVGDGPEKKYLQQKIKEYNLKNVTLISRFLDDKSLEGLIRASRFVVFPSCSLETFGISILESYACGKPVIASRIGAFPEIVNHGFNGFLFSPGNIDDLAAKIVDLWENLDLCKKMGRNARNFVEKKYNPEIHYQLLMQVYEKAIHG